MKTRLRTSLCDLMLIPGLSGFEGRVRQKLASELSGLGLTHSTDRMGNLIATMPGVKDAPSVMLFAHMDQIGMIVRKIEADGLIRVERLGGLPERALAAQEVLFQIAPGRDIGGIIAHKSHHATAQDEKYRVLPIAELFIDAGFADALAAEKAGVKIGTPVVYAPSAMHLGANRIAGSSVDDRAGCAVILEVARALTNRDHPTLHLVFSVQEEFNLRGAVSAANALQPDIAIQLDLALATDTPDMASRGDVRLGTGPVMSLYSFHGRGTLNGTIPHPALVNLVETTAAKQKINLQRSAQSGVLTDSSYVQLVGQGVACIDLCFPCRYTHSAREVCDLDDLVGLTELLVASIAAIGPQFSLNRDDFLQ